MNLRRGLLTAGLAFPVVYAVNLIAAVLRDPGYSLARQLPSELGGPHGAHPLIFNLGLIAAGLLGMAGGAGVTLGLRRAGAAGLLSALAGASMLLAAASFVFAGLFPLPHPLHHGFNIALAGALTPLLAALALWTRERRLALAFLAAFLLPFVLFAAGSALASGRDSGLWTLAIGLSMMASMAALCGVLRAKA